MADFIGFEPDAWFIRDVVWQSSLFLLAGSASVLILFRRPARAHRVLLLAIVGALITPLCGQLVRKASWGLWTTNPPDASAVVARSAARTPSRAGSPARRVQDRESTVSPHAMSSVEPPPAAIPISTAAVGGNESAVQGGEARSGLLDRLSLRAVAPIRFPKVFFSLWCVVSGLLVVRLVVSLIRGHCVAGRARPGVCESIEQAAGAACQRLGLRVRPELRASSEVDCPAIWCWGRRPVIVLPEAAETAAKVDWTGVFCHEMAHRVRGDHWSSLLGELLTAALPWHPLAWWARLRLGQLSELACDDCVLGTGLPAADYAESLLVLVPRRGAPLALAVVSSRRGLFGRIQHILDERRSSPVVGKRWAWASAVAVLLAASALALAQSRPPVSTGQSVKPKDDPRPVHASKPASASRKQIAMKHTIHGTIQGPDDQPVAGATVFLVAYTKPPVHRAIMPRDRPDQREPRHVILAETTSQAGGRYSLPASIEPNDFTSLQVVVLAPSFGLDSLYLKKYGETLDPVHLDATERTHHLAPQVAIHGRLLSPSGMPAAGVRVTLNGFFNDDGMGGMRVGITPTDEEIPSYWPKSSPTGADGRFTLVGVPHGTFATLTFWHPDYAVDEVAVSTTGNDSLSPRMRPYYHTSVKPTFTHTLEPARPVEGRVTDKDTGKPMAGMLVGFMPVRQQGGFQFFARTDADGHYRISGHAGASIYTTTVYPAADSGYLVSSDSQQGWPAGAKLLEKNFALEKGRILRGRVIDADTRRPVASAAVVYRAKPGNPNARDNARGENSVLTDANGRFTVTGLPGEGDLVVEAASEYVRTRFERGDNRRPANFPHGHAPVSASASGEPAPVEITVRKGVTFEAHVVGPDGKPVSPFAAYCPELNGIANNPAHISVNFLDDRFIFPGADPNRTYKVILVSARHQLAAVVEIKPDAKVSEPVEIRLQQAARVHGRLVNPSGTPVSDGQIYSLVALYGKPKSMSPNAILTEGEFYLNLIEASARLKYPYKPGAQGEFTQDALVPGLPFYIGADSGRREVFHYVSPLQPGEDRDLGTITLKDRQP